MVSYPPIYAAASSTEYGRIPFVGSDTGGFGSDTTEDLMLRWLQYALFTPLFRNHSADGTREQELYRFDNVQAAAE